MNKITSFEQIGGKPDELNPLMELINSLAQLHPLEYDQKRKEIAREKNIRISTIDELVAKARKAREEGQKNDEQFKEWQVSPWPDEVDGEQLLDAALHVLERYVIADQESLHVAAAWAALTWLADYATVLPMAMISAPEKGCGKTILLSVVAAMACRTLQASNITQSALFRSIELWKPALFIDEADSFMRENEAIRGLLNSGYTKDSAFKILSEEIGGKLQPVRYSTWGPKAIAGIKLETLDATLTSRSIIIPMRRKMPAEKTENFRHADPAQFEELKSKFLRWSLDNGPAFSNLRPVLSGLSNRDADNWEPLLAIAELAGGGWPLKIRQAALKIVEKKEDAPSLDAELLSDIRNVFADRKIERISSAHLLEALTVDDLAPWKTYNRGQPLTARQLADRLRPYGIYPNSVRIPGIPGHPKGYKLEDFTEAFQRYIPLSVGTPDGAGTTGQPAADTTCSDLLSGTEKSVSPIKNNPFSASGAACPVVTDKKGYAGKDIQITEELF